MAHICDPGLQRDPHPPSPMQPVPPSNLYAPSGDPAPDIDEATSYSITSRSLVDPNPLVYENIVSLLANRVELNNGECFYEVGIGDDSQQGLAESEMEAAIATLHRMSGEIGCRATLLRQREVSEGLTVAEFIVRRMVGESDFIEVRVAVVGNVDAGKSTLLGVLTHGELDNGRGVARQKLFRHKHEMETGRTSSVGNDILGFDIAGNIVNKVDAHSSSLDWTSICEDAAKVVTFIDLAGHEKYLKTTIFGMTGHVPDFGMLMIGANAGIIGMTKEHLGLALALSVPVFVVVTKIDMCPSNVLAETLKLLHKVLKSPGCRKIPVPVSNKDDVIVTASNFTSQRVCPIFQVSNVTGENLPLLKTFLNLLSPRMGTHATDASEFQIDDIYSVPGVGTVVSGTTMRGVIQLNDSLLLGPDPLGQFVNIAIRTIHRKRMPVKEVRGGQTASFALKKIKRSQIRKGMVIVSPAVQPQACWEFEGDILVLHHPTTICARYQAMVHCGSVRQTASITAMDLDCLRTGDKSRVHFRFIKQPEYIREGSRLVFREGRTKAVGNVVKVFPHVVGLPQSHRAVKVNKMRPRGCEGEPLAPLSGNKENQPRSRGRRSRRGNSESGVTHPGSTASRSDNPTTHRPRENESESTQSRELDK